MSSLWSSSEGQNCPSQDRANWKMEETRGQKQTPYFHDQVCLELWALPVATRLEPILVIFHGGSRHSSLAWGCIISLILKLSSFMY